MSAMIEVQVTDVRQLTPVVREFTGRVRERALGAEVSGALNPGQQVVKIVNEELVGILGGQTLRLTFAKRPPTVIMLAGLQGSGKTTFAGKLARLLRDMPIKSRIVVAHVDRGGELVSNGVDVRSELHGVTMTPFR